jgi:N-acetyl-1-D-myo-inositol-2-amino-2-deoxy-alpha-D-glucopyranoside deacetylase
LLQTSARTLLLVHAHPDDESIMTGGVMARAHLDGHRVVLVTATRGEASDIHNMDEVSARPQLGEIRSRELLEACEILGVDRQEFLGYRDSGMNGAPTNQHPDSLHRAPLTDVADRLALLLREERPDVVVTYTADGTYQHPDHLKAHGATMAALDTLAGEGWQPRKVYLLAVPSSFARIVVEAARSGGIELPEGLNQISGVPDEDITTEVDVSEVLDRKLAACVAHLSQMHPGLPLATMAAEVFEHAFGVERFILARGQLGSERPEKSLFSGV